MIVSLLLIGLGIIFLVLGAYMLYKHYSTPAPNEELAWVGFGEHPFKKK